MLHNFSNKYIFDTEGNVYSKFSAGRYPKLLETPKIMKSQVDVHGYLRYTLLNNDSKQCTVFKHKIVLYANNILPEEHQTQVNHKDGNKLNNSISNLEWVTNLENQIHKFEVLNVKSTRRKFTEEEIKIIRDEYSYGIMGKGFTALATKYNVSYSTIRDIILGITYKRIIT